MAYLETIKSDKETNLPHIFELDQWKGNGDLFITINLCKNLETFPNLRIYSSFGSSLTPINTYEALISLKKLLDWEDIDIEVKDFINKATVNNLEGSISVEYIKKENKVIFTIKQTKENGNERFTTRNASIIFVLENSTTESEELVIGVKKEIFDCLANLQHAILQDNKLN